jgi:hypothetical protein
LQRSDAVQHEAVKNDAGAGLPGSVKPPMRKPAGVKI